MFADSLWVGNLRALAAHDYLGNSREIFCRLLLVAASGEGRVQGPVRPGRSLALLANGITAIDWKGHAGDKVGTTRGEENCCANNFV